MKTMRLSDGLETKKREKRGRVLKELMRMDQTLNGLCRIAEELNRCTSEQEVLHKALERAAELPMVLSGWILLREGEAGFKVAAVHNLPPSLETPGAMEGDCLCRRRLLSGELDGAVNILECARLKGIPGGKCGPVQHASIPLWAGHRTLGIMNLAGQAGAFGERDLKTLYSVGHQVAVALERARLHQHLEQMVRERTHALEYKATHDSITDLPNQTLFNDRLRQALLIAGRENKPMAVLVIDLNRFKEVNNTLGHVIGDQLLKQIGFRIRGVMRASDTLARLAGDKFGTLLPSTAPEGAKRVVEKILKALETPFPVEEFTLDIEATIGIAHYPDQGEDASTLLRRADVAMYTARQAGNPYGLYAADLDPYKSDRLLLLGGIRKAIDDNQLFLCYQPQVDIRTRSVLGVEALVRWRHPQRGVIPPDQFIMLAEQTGLIKPLTLWVLKEALRQCSVWCKGGMEIPTAVNLSARNLQDPGIPDQISELLEGFGMPPHCLELEITESAIMADPARAMEILTRLSQMGIRLAIDDFGTGYSSLNCLKRLPVNTIKIDKSFVMKMTEDKDDEVIVGSTIDLAHNLDLKVVAEGVEKREILDLLDNQGCDRAQGYYISRPISAEEFTQWMCKSPWNSNRKNA